VIPISAECSHGVAYCTAGTTSHGCVPSIASSGFASASATSGFVISAAQVEGQKQGLVFYGVNGFAKPPVGSSSSYLCVKAPTQRTTIVPRGGTASQCDGNLSIDWSAYVAANPSSVGAPFSGRGHRLGTDLVPRSSSPKTTSLSDALAFVVAP
jgi:hypothetical protein